MKKRIFSGIQPSGDLTLGNYLGALRNWPRLQEDYHAIYSIVDLHAITVKQDPKLLKERTLLTLALYLAAGIDPEKSILFIQSHVPQHAELNWLLACHTYMGELSRMTQFKDKSSRLNQKDSIPSGLFNYPTLMAADILLYQAQLVPVGEDQSQHLELTRDLAIRFNNAYGKTFAIPKGYFNPFGAKIYDLQNPTATMSKSSVNQNGVLFLMEEEKSLRKKIARSVTDNLAVIRYSDEQAGVKNLLNIYSLLSGKTPDKTLLHFEGKGYKALKDDVSELVLDELLPLQKRTLEYLGDTVELEKIYSKGAKKAKELAKPTLEDVKEKLGFVI